ncbi:MAG: lamin tail domain-containing protein, partial [Patescibacteria group bacterium]
MCLKEKTIISAIFLSAAFFIAPKIVFAQVIINEIMYDLAGTDDKHEWVELYNNGSAPVDLTDYKFNDGDNATNHSLNIPPKNNGRGSIILDVGGYALLAGDAATLIADLPNYNGTIIDTVLSLSNTSATLKLLDKDGLGISTVSYTKDLGAAGNGRTLEWDGAALKESSADGGTPGRTNNIVSSTSLPPSAAPSVSPATTTAATSSPGTTIQTFDYSKDILINEFLPAPSSAGPAPNDGEKEWIELFNAGSSVINLAGWQIDDTDNSTSPQIIPENTIIYANGFLVISFNKSTLNNEGDKVRLLWPDDQVVHAVSYSKAKPGQSVAKFGTSWLWTNQPTPGQANKKSATSDSESADMVTAAEKINPIEESVTTPV